VVSFTPLQLYLWGDSRQYPLYGRLVGPQSQSGCHAEEKNLLPLLGIEPRFLGHLASSLVAILIDLS
jgi:hypothetical protein